MKSFTTGRKTLLLIMLLTPLAICFDSCKKADTLRTPANTLPILSTIITGSITSTSAISGGNITGDGGSPVLSRGVVWCTSSNPTIELNTKTIDGIGTGSFISKLNGLSPDTTYFVRAYATTSLGTAYGNEVSFKFSSAISLPLVWVGTNEYVAYPADSSILYGYVGLNNQNASYFWRKVAGPASYNIHKPDSLVTKVDKLEIGEYEFEITATDVNGRQSSSALNVYVIKPGQNETIFKNLEWSCPFQCSVFIKNIYSFLPQNKPLLVFIRPTNSSTWYPSLPPEFEYGIYTNTFSLSTNAADGKVDVKIQY